MGLCQQPPARAEAEVDRVTALAVQIAKASALTRVANVDLGPAEEHVGSYRTPVEIDPFAVPLNDKVSLLLESDREARAVKGVAVAESSLTFIRENKTFASTEGSYIEQETTESGLGLVVIAVGEGEMQQRSYPNSFGRHQGTAGYEFVQQWDLAGNARRIGEEVVALLSAPQCPARRDDDHPRRAATGPPDPRIVRAPDRAGPRVRHGSCLSPAPASSRRTSWARSATAPTWSTSLPTR